MAHQQYTFKIAARLALCLLALTLALAPLAARAQIDRPHCEICGRFWDKSPSRLNFMLEIGHHIKSVQVCSPLCMSKRLLRHPEIPAQRIAVCYFPEGKNRGAQMLKAPDAFFLYGIKSSSELCEKPYTAAFKTREEAKQAQAKLGGDLLKWDEVLQRSMKLAKDAQAPKEEEEEPRGRRPH